MQTLNGVEQRLCHKIFAETGGKSREDSNHSSPPRDTLSGSEDA
jgi:hypothetical protein